MLDSQEWILEWGLTARKQQRNLEKSVAQRILKKLAWLRLSPDPKELLKELGNNRAGTHRLRVQEYRVILEIDEETHTLLILEVGHRKDIYED
jgi:mRNA interferase RelE/StbE